uniref:Uncharacterized protein n=1 Tax=Daphnia galeata TaxID=27404 RepID=A0A8J2WCH0_9CRUS|nr:unnamed protein product [Daphnia galeata]
MSRSIFENFKEYDTFEWMDSHLWKELIEATKTVLQTHGSSDSNINKLSSVKPTSATTTNLKLAFVVKDNALKKTIFMEPTSTKTGKIGLFGSLSNLEKLMIMSVSLNKPDVKLQDLHMALSQNREERQIKISSYFV